MTKRAHWDLQNDALRDAGKREARLAERVLKLEQRLEQQRESAAASQAVLIERAQLAEQALSWCRTRIKVLEGVPLPRRLVDAMLTGRRVIARSALILLSLLLPACGSGDSSWDIPPLGYLTCLVLGYALCRMGEARRRKLDAAARQYAEDTKDPYANRFEDWKARQRGRRRSGGFRTMASWRMP
jgi:hypothetical protein